MGLAIVVVVVTRVPFAQFRQSMAHGPHLALASTELAIAMIVLAMDALSTWIGLFALQIRWPLKRVAAIKGATYLLFLLNYAVGQGGFGYYLYRDGQPALRAVGATLFLLGTTLATLLLVTFGACAIIGISDSNPQLWWLVVGGTAAFLVYLCVIWLRPSLVAKRQILAPLFDSGLRGHAIALAGRLPHVVAIVLSHWVAMRVWGIEVPFAAALTLMPAVALAAALPIAPAGLGTTQVALVYYFAAFANGATAGEREANILAFGIVHFVYGVLAALVVGLVCLFVAKRMGAMPSNSNASAEPPFQA